MSAIDHEPFPRGALIATAAMLGVTLAGTAAVRIAHIYGPVAPVSAPAAVSAVSLRFADEQDGSMQGHGRALGRPGRDRWRPVRAASCAG